MDRTTPEELRRLPRIAIFGGGGYAPTSAEYRLGKHAGRVVAGSGRAVLTGGYAGMMEAASRGAREAGGDAIGVLYAPPEETAPNRHLTHFLVAEDYQARMAELLRAPAALVLPGGSGTFAELGACLALLQRFPRRALALWEPAWGELLRSAVRSWQGQSTLPGSVAQLRTAEELEQWAHALNVMDSGTE